MSANTETTGGPPHVAGQIVDMVNSGLISAKQGRELLAGPIAAPAAHVERRKGQRWKFRNRHAAHFDATIVERKGLGWKVTDVVDHDGGGKSRAFSDVFWEEPNYYTMTLLADAAPEPAKPEATTIMDCAVKPGWSHFPGVVCECKGTPAKLPPVQEAPKTAPVCAKCQSTDDVRDTRFDAIKRLYCKPCRSGLEAWLSVQTGERRTAGPALIDRRLAADWAEDCLGDVR